MIKTDKFKSTYVEVIFSSDIKKDTITINNFLSTILTYSTKKYNTRIAFSKKIEELYAASIYSNCYRLGKTFNIDFNLRVLNDKLLKMGYLRMPLIF